MLSTMKRGLLVGSVAAVVAALLGGSALAARGHGHANFGVRGHGGGFLFGGPGGGPMFGGPGFGGPAFAGPGFGGPAFGGPGFGGPGFGRGHGPGGPGMRGGPGGGLLAGEVLKTAAAYLQMPIADLQTALKGGKTLAQVATDKGKTAAGLVTALTDAAKANLDAAVAAGWITQKQADVAIAGVTREITALVNNGPPVLPARKGGPLDAAATYLGMTVEQIHTALKDGKTLAQLVTAPKTVDGLVTALTADARARLDKAVASGDLTQAQENTILSKLTERVTDFVNGVRGPKAATTTTNAIKKTVVRYTVKASARR
jgi:hypothetical protein